MDNATGQKTPANVPSVRPELATGSEMLPNSTYPAGSVVGAGDENKLPNCRNSRDVPAPLVPPLQIIIAHIPTGSLASFASLSFVVFLRILKSVTIVQIVVYSPSIFLLGGFGYHFRWGQRLMHGSGTT
uniref:Uncharacterized protein n=1 Tax=Anopheles coluzzii TaxID=1518534 RepID=A0A8W7NY96_ANOCL